MRTILLVILCFGFRGILPAQTVKGEIDPAKIPAPQQHFLEEYTFDQPSDPEGWKNHPHGLNAAFGSPDERYLRCEIPSGTTANWHQTGWKGERLGAQVIVWSPDTVKQIRFRLSDLKSPSGTIISREHIRLNLVRYVVSNFPYAAEVYGCETGSDKTFLLPDRFEPLERFDLPGNTVRSVWISVDVPGNADPGQYSGIIEIVSPQKTVKLDLSLQVQNMRVPEPHDWSFRLDLWQNPWVIAWYYHVEPWSEEHKALLRKHLKLYADAGGTYITTYAVHSPWADNSYMIEGSMIEWIRTSSGDWKYDYKLFDEYVELAMELGIDRAITVYTPLPWANRFRYLDDKTGNYIYEVWEPGSEKFNTNLNIFLDDLKEHLTQKGWLDRTYLGINENTMEYTMAAAKLIKAHSAGWKITYAGDWHPELSEFLDDYCAIVSKEPGLNDIKIRTQKGFTTTYYVCCHPPRPNNFIFSVPSESRFIGWHTMASGYDGFLRWAYDAWTADPVRDARHVYWPAGDCFLVYPGAASSIRYEKLREGIVDFEKVRILRELAAGKNNNRATQLIADLDQLLNKLVDERDYAKRDYSIEKINSTLIKGNQLIIQLTDELSK